MKEAAIPGALGDESFEQEAREGWLSWVASVDHKQIGILYLLGAFIFFLVGGVVALLMRVQLAVPNNHFLSPQMYNQIFTMHGTTMIFLVVVPLLVGFATYLVPLMIGARDMAFPRLNALSFWVQLFGGLMLYFSFAPGERRRARGGVVLLRAAERDRLLVRPRRGLLDARPARHRRGHGHRRDQPHRHHHLHARARHDYPAPAAVRLDDADNRLPDRRGAAGAQRGAGDAADRPAAQRAFLSGRHRRLGGAVAALSSGPSAIPRSTSWSCPPSESSPRSSRSSRASRSSATSSWPPRRWRSRS